MFEYITKIQQFGSFIESLSDMSLQLMGFDIETTGLDCFEDKILLIQVKLNNKTYIFDIQKLGVKHSTYLIQLIKDSNKTLIGHNIKFDIKFVKFHFGELFENVYDTQIAENIITNGIAKDRYPSLSDLVLKYFKVFLDKTVRESFIGSEEITQDKLIYSAEDVNYLEGLYHLQVNKIREQKQIPVLDLEMKLVPVVAQMELNGIKLDQEKWLELAKYAEQRVKDLEIEIKEEMISRMNLASYSSLRTLLDDYCITYKKTKKEAELLDLISPEFAHDAIYERINPASNRQVTVFLQKCGYQVDSSGKEVLNDLYSTTEDELITKLLEYRSFDKASGSFGENFLENVHPLTRRIHSNFNQMGTRSGRFSSSKINLQNIKSDKEDTPLKYRDCFVSEEGWKIVGADMSQEEYRLAGAVSEEPAIIEAYKNGSDMHTQTAAIVYKVPVSEVTKDQRKHAKTVNFSVLYGTSAYGMALKQKISKEEAQAIIDGFYNGYPKLSSFFAEYKKNVLNKLFAVTLLGRKRFFERPKIFADEREFYKWKSSVEREGGNHIIQGCIHEDSRVFARGYGYVPIKSLADKFVELWDGEQFSSGTVKYSGKKQLVNITMRDRRVLKASPDHKFFVKDNKGKEAFRTVESISKQQRIVFTGELPDFSYAPKLKEFKSPIGNANNFSLNSIGNSYDLGLFLGRFASDGTMNKNAVTLIVAEHEKEIIPRLYDIMCRVGKTKIKEIVRENRNQTLYHITMYSYGVAEQLRYYKARHSVPEFVFLDKEMARGFLCGMYDGDGGVSGNVILTFGRPAFNEKFARDVQELLTLFGINSRITFWKLSIHLAIQKNYIKDFVDKIGFLNSIKNKKAMEVYKTFSRQKSAVYGNAMRTKSIEFTGDFVDMYDFVDSSTGKFMMSGVITHNSAGDIIKECLIRLHYENPFGKGMKIILTVHDEVELEVKEEFAEQAKEFLQRIMEEVEQKYLGELPAKADAYISDKWEH